MIIINRSASLLDHSLDPCMKDFGFIPDTKVMYPAHSTHSTCEMYICTCMIYMYAYLISLQDKTYIMFISMVKRNDYETWMQLAKVHCYLLHVPPLSFLFTVFSSSVLSSLGS